MNKKVLRILLFGLFSFCLLSLNGLAQNSDKMYEKEWREIDSLDESGLPQSALKTLNRLAEKIDKEAEVDQYLKILFYRAKFITQTNEDGLIKAITELESHIVTASFPVKPILQSILGQFYQSYLETVYWEISERTKVEALPQDFRTWSVEDLVAKSTALFEASIQSKEELKAIPISDFPEIIQKGRLSDGLRNSLFDVLAHRAIDNFTNERNYLTQPAYQFVVNEEAVFSTAATFSKIEWNTRDTGSHKLKALQILQDLILIHIDDQDPRALVDVDLKRLKLVHEYATFNDKDQRYLEALLSIKGKYENDPAEAEVMSAISNRYYIEGADENAQFDSLKKWRYKDAYDLCTQCIEKYPESYGASQCKGLQTNILETHLYLETEMISLPRQPILVNVNYRNIEDLFFRVVKIEKRDEDAIRRRNNKDQLDYIFNLKPIQTKSYQLPNPGDYQNHSTEIMLDGLDYGRYAIISAADKKFNRETSLSTISYVTISQISYFQRRGENGSHEFVLMDRKTGEPLSEVRAEFFINEYNSKKKAYDYIKIGEQYSDWNGLLLSKTKSRKYWNIKFSKGQDELFLHDSYYNYSNKPNRSAQKSSSIFLDRAIYRPGQTVYFKAILLEADGKGLTSILANEKVTLSLLDANNQEIDKQSFTSNEYGTLSGRFKTPTNVLLGRMRIQPSIGGSVSFRVEEYKRPKFEVLLSDLEESYAVGDEVIVKGTASGFAGNAIDGAKVNYRVYRSVRYPWTPWWMRRPQSSGNVEISRGELSTDELGEFEFSFEALPDLNAVRSRNPMFRFSVEVDVVDITGETHSDSRIFNLGYQGLIADIKLDEKLDRTAVQSIQISTTNLNGQTIEAEGQLSIHSLASPNHYFIERYWKAPELYLLSKEEYREHFPLIAYQGENLPYNWEQTAQQFNTSFNTKENSEIELNIASWPIGHYVAILQTKDNAGNEIKKEVYFYLYDSKTKEFPKNILFSDAFKKTQLQPGDELIYEMAAHKKDLPVLFEIEHQGGLVRQEWVRLKKATQLEERIKEAYRGGIMVYSVFIHENRPTRLQQRIDIPWLNKKLDISYGTFRDKLRPGQEEKWELKIAGPDKDKVAAEMLVGMYDASLDQFVPHSWYFNPYPSFRYGQLNWRAQHFRSGGSQLLSQKSYPNYQRTAVRTYPSLNLFGLQYIFYSRGRYYPSSYAATARSVEPTNIPISPTIEMADMSVEEESAPLPELQKSESPGPPPPPPPPGEAPLGGQSSEPNKEVSPRTNLNETVFFMPDLKTDEEGNVVISFTMNEALTRWKFMGLAHTKDLKIGLTQKEVLTQKELMILPNPPRFLRQDDELEFTAKVTNLTEAALNGQAELQFFEASTMEPISSQLINSSLKVPFEIEAGRSAAVAWTLKVPKEMTSALVYRVIARSEEFSDGEENALPVLSNRIFVTESMPITVKGRSTKTFQFERLEKVLSSSTATPHQFNMEITSNPTWLAIKALPYLMEYPHECTEQLFNRFYANSLAMGIANAHPSIKDIFKKWENTDALESELMKNQELKSAILEETPWVMDAMAEEQQRRNMANLFDEERMNSELFATLTKLEERQSDDGGFPWFPGGRNSRYITQLVVEGLGHLEFLGIQNNNEVRQGNTILEGAIAFMDNALQEEYAQLEKLVKRGVTNFDQDHLSYLAIHYLYARSFFPDLPVAEASTTAYSYYVGQAEEYWLNKGLYQQGMIGLALDRMERPLAPAGIIASLKERALKSDEMGVFWNYSRSYWWYELPIETHSMLIELFAQAGDDAQFLEDMKIWLLRNKQTTSWETTKATAAAVFALLNQGKGINQIEESWLVEQELVKISFPEIKKKEYQVKLAEAEAKAEPGTGYYKVNWNKEEMQKGLSQLKIKNKNKGISWGGAFWQYFEDIDKIEAYDETPLQLNKQIYKQELTDRGPVLNELKEGRVIEPGDKLIVRIELRVDRDMEYIHMKDMRGSGLEPLEVFSTYKWQDGLGYYQSTKDVATNFFFDYLPKGTYVFEYPLRVIHKGNYSSGITTIQSMYAPEFSSHSSSVRLKVE